MRSIFSKMFGVVLAAGALALTVTLATPALKADDDPAKEAAVTSVKGTYNFGGNKSTWSAKLKATDTPGVYDADYVADKKMTYKGKITTDWKTEIKGDGKATGGGGNGTFKFSGKFDDKGVAKCPYKEVGGGRNGSLTVDSFN